MKVMCAFGKITTWLLQNSFSREVFRDHNCPALPENILFWEFGSCSLSTQLRKQYSTQFQLQRSRPFRTGVAGLFLPEGDVRIPVMKPKAFWEEIVFFLTFWPIWNGLSVLNIVLAQGKEWLLETTKENKRLLLLCRKRWDLRWVEKDLSLQWHG